MKRIVFLPFIISCVLSIALSAGLCWAGFALDGPGSAQAVDEYPFTIVELTLPVEPAVRALEQAGLGPVLYRDSALVPLSRVSSIEYVPLVDLPSRLDAGDLRLNPYASRLLSQFDGPSRSLGGPNTQLLFVPGRVDHIEQVLKEWDGLWFIHVRRGLPFGTGLLLWALSCALFLLFLPKRRWTIASALTLLPAYLVLSPPYLALVSILFIALREVGSICEQRFRSDLNSGRFTHLPESIVGRAFFSSRRIASDAALQGLWSLGVLLSMLGLSFFYRDYRGLFVIFSCFAWLISCSLYLILIFRLHVRQEHQLFMYQAITPSWDKPDKRERAVVFSILLMSLTVPVVFTANSSPFSTELLSFQPLYADELGEDSGFTGENSDEFPDDMAQRQTQLITRDALTLLNERVQEEQRAPVRFESESSESAAAGEVEEGRSEWNLPALFLADLAYQEAFPYLSIGVSDGAGRYDDGRVQITRFRRDEHGMVAYDEQVFALDEPWIVSASQDNNVRSMLRLYSVRNRWYDVRPEPGRRVSSVAISPWFEMLLILFWAVPWLGRWQFGPVRAVVATVRRLVGKKK